MTHADLVIRAGRYLRNSLNCSVVITQHRAMIYTGEIPDAIGFQITSASVLIECKTSLQDFKKDQRKIFRQESRLGMGQFRFYMAPVGLLGPEDMPKGWGLLVVEGRSTRKACGPEGQLWTWPQQGQWRHEFNMEAEFALVLSAHRRCGIPSPRL